MSNLVKDYTYFTKTHKWGEVFKSGPGKSLWKTVFKSLKACFKGCLSQILLGPLLNTLSKIKYCLNSDYFDIFFLKKWITFKEENEEKS